MMSDKYAALRAAAKNATPGEWRSDDHHGVIADAGLNGNYYIASCSGPEHRDNKRFIAAANPATILELLAERDADKRRITELEKNTKVKRINVQRYDLVYIPNVGTGVGPKPNGDYVKVSDISAAGISLKIEGE